MPRATPLQRFLGHIIMPQDDPDGCWLWKGGHKRAGYGQFWVDGRKVIAHRWSYEHHVGPIPDGYEVDHAKCRDPRCVNPAHLEAVTLAENRARRNAARTHCVNGHEYTPESTRWWTDRDGYRSRSCRICLNASARRRRATGR